MTTQDRLKERFLQLTPFERELEINQRAQVVNQRQDYSLRAVEAARAEITILRAMDRPAPQTVTPESLRAEGNSASADAMERSQRIRQHRRDISEQQQIVEDLEKQDPALSQYKKLKEAQQRLTALQNETPPDPLQARVDTVAALRRQSAEARENGNDSDADRLLIQASRISKGMEDVPNE